MGGLSTEVKSDTGVAFAEVGVKSDTGVAFAAVESLSAEIGVSIQGTRSDLADAAADHAGRSRQHMLAAGVLLIALKRGCSHGDFGALLEERGFEVRAAQRAMQYAAFIASLDDEARAKLIRVPVKKVLALANADPEVIEVVLEEGGADLNALSYRAVMERKRELEAKLVNAEVKLDTVTAERDTAIAKLSRQPGDRDDHVPAVFADARAEIAVLQRKAAVSIESMHQSVRELAEMGGGKDAAAWRDGTARMALAGLAELRMAVSAALADVLAMLPEEGVVVPATLSRLSDQEVAEVAAHWRSLTRVHEYEREIRATQRHNEANSGKRGRPREMPKAPVGTAGTGSTGKRGR